MDPRAPREGYRNRYSVFGSFYHEVLRYKYDMPPSDEFDLLTARVLAGTREINASSFYDIDEDPDYDFIEDVVGQIFAARSRRKKLAPAKRNRGCSSPNRPSRRNSTVDSTPTEPAPHPN
jgi:hypothetical protein